MQACSSFNVPVLLFVAGMMGGDSYSVTDKCGHFNCCSYIEKNRGNGLVLHTDPLGVKMGFVFWATKKNVQNGVKPKKVVRSTKPST